MTRENTIPRWFDGSDNMHRTARAIAKYGPVAQAPLAQLEGLTSGTLSRIVGDLEELDVVVEGGEDGFGEGDGGERRGRPQTLLQLNRQAATAIGMKVTGDEIVATAIDFGGDAVTAAYRRQIVDRQPDAVVALIVGLVDDCERELALRSLPRPVGVGVAFGGHVVDGSVVDYAPFLHWNDPVDVGAVVFERTGLPCAAFNDVNSLAFMESWFGEGHGLGSLAVVTVGAGIGYSLTARGELVDGSNASYGLAAHVPLDSRGPLCTAGHVGCSQCLTDESLATQYSELRGTAETFDDFVRDARDNVPQATLLANRICFRIGTLVAAIANLAMPEKVVLSGESAFVAKFDAESVREGIAQFRHTQAAPVDFAVVDHPASDWARAAATRVIGEYLR
ncbi:ROK family protein [Bifidobacterium choloepi]|uniref:ROK family protein n=1 Tax=Bifidobacterium choloepi TaxID=2614131 RepID=A0A6I5NMH5_9BIFI|nr:ROK family protein [Bifidobacterium choloepi]NEG69942.1 ROK family protein [Bifidobacterium choloepi]